MKSLGEKLLAAIEATSGPVGVDVPPETATATIEGLRGEVERLRKSLQWLSFCAQTSGGTAGPDLSLMQAIAMAEAELNPNGARND